MSSANPIIHPNSLPTTTSNARSLDISSPYITMETFLQQSGAAPGNHDLHTESSSPTNLPSGSSGTNRKEKSRVSLFIGDLSYFCTEQDLLSLFAPYGPIVNVHIRKGVHGNSLMHGFIVLRNADNAKKVIQDINDKEYMGRHIK